MQVTTTPVHNATGVVTSGVEIFQDVSSMLFEKFRLSNPGSFTPYKPSRL